MKYTILITFLLVMGSFAGNPDPEEAPGLDSSVNSDSKIYPIDYYTKVDVANKTVKSVYVNLVSSKVESFLKQRTPSRIIRPSGDPIKAWRYHLIVKGDIGWCFEFWANEYVKTGWFFGEKKIARLYLSAIAFDGSGLYSIKLIKTEKVEDTK